MKIIGKENMVAVIIQSLTMNTFNVYIFYISHVWNSVDSRFVGTWNEILSEVTIEGCNLLTLKWNSTGWAWSLLPLLDL